MKPVEATGAFVILQGAMARITGKARSSCPHKRGSAQALCWRWGFDQRENALPPRRRRNIPRETKPGRGRPRAGRRADWPQRDLAVLALCDGNVLQWEIAAMLGQSHQAVRCRLTRLRKEREAGGRPPPAAPDVKSVAPVPPPSRRPASSGGNS